MPQFDVFVSHNSQDKAIALAIAERLRAEGISPWLDDWNLVPGQTWQTGLAAGIDSCACAALLIGAHGAGPWQSAETMLIARRAFEDPSFRLIPVFLPEAPTDPGPLLPTFVNLFTSVDFRSGIDDPAALRRLIAGVRGKPPGPYSARSDVPWIAPAMTELDRCLIALGVPNGDLRLIAGWLAQTVADKRSGTPLPDLGWPSELHRAVTGFRRELQLFAWPERLLENIFYLSHAKLNRMYRAHRDELPQEEGAAGRFRLLYRYMSAELRLAFGPSLLLLGEPLPSDGDTWLYFTGDFTLALDQSVYEAVPEARQVLESNDEKNFYNVVSRIFESPDPSFLRFLPFSGSIGKHQVTMLMSRKYVRIVHSGSAKLSISALRGEPMRFAGFGTLYEDELRPVACRLS
jgi:hypothetical protein